MTLLSVMACSTPGGGTKSKIAVYSWEETEDGVTYRLEANFYSDNSFDSYFYEGSYKELYFKGTFSGDPTKDGTIILKAEGQSLSLTVVNGKVDFMGMELTREELPAKNDKTVVCKYYMDDTINGVYCKNEFVFYANKTYDFIKCEGSYSEVFFSGKYSGDPTKDGKITIIIEDESFQVEIKNNQVNFMGAIYKKETTNGSKTWNIDLKDYAYTITSTKNAYVEGAEYDAFVDLNNAIPFSSLKAGDTVEITYSVSCSSSMSWVGAFLIDNSPAANNWMNLSTNETFLYGKSLSGKLTFEIKNVPKGSVVLQLYYSDYDAPVTFTFN